MRVAVQACDATKRPVASRVGPSRAEYSDAALALVPGAFPISGGVAFLFMSFGRAGGPPPPRLQGTTPW